jgi:hypothetical protein
MLGPVVTKDGVEEWVVDCIVDKCKRGCGFQYLVRWAGWDKKANCWLPRRLLEHMEALDHWLETKHIEAS